MKELNIHDRFFLKPEDIEADTFKFSGGEIRHLKVKRLKRGTRLQGLDGNGGEYLGEILSFDDKEVSCRILEFHKHLPPKRKILLGMSVIKASALAAACEKAAELGAGEIHLINSAHSEREPNPTEIERLNRITLAAMKQSGRFFWCKVFPPMELTNIIQRFRKECAIIACQQQGDSIFDMKFEADILLLVGPEGGFSGEELMLMSRAGTRRIKLGNFRMQSETAAAMAAGIMALLIESD